MMRMRPIQWDCCWQASRPKWALLMFIINSDFYAGDVFFGDSVDICIRDSVDICIRDSVKLIVRVPIVK